MPDLTPTVLVEYYGASAWRAVTADVRSEAGITITRGMPGSMPDDRIAVTGTCEFSLRNDARNSGSTLGYYSPDHASVRTGWALGVPLRVKLTDPAGPTYTVFYGRVDAVDPVPGKKGPRTVRVVAVDWLDEAARWNVPASLGEQVGKRADELITTIVSAMPVAPYYSSYDTGRESYPYALDVGGEDQTAALTELARIAGSELGFVYVKGDGTLKFEGRHARLLNTTVSATLTDTELSDLALASSRSDIINTVRVTVWPRVVDATPTTVLYSQVNAIPIGAGETLTLLGPYRDPVTGDRCGGVEMQALVSGSDYVINAAENGSGADLTGSATVAVEFGAAGARFEVTNGSASAGYITTLQARGRGVYAHSSVTLEATDSASKTAYGERVATLSMPYQAKADVGQAAATWLLDAYSDPAARLKSLTFYGRTTALVTHALARELSDRVRVTETVTGLSSDDFNIQSIKLAVLPSGHVRAEWGLVPAPAATSYFVIGTSSIGTGVLAPF